MSCVNPAPGVLVCGAGPRLSKRALKPCPVEGGRIRRMVVFYAGLMYGDDLMCLGCGDKWGEEGRYPRPFARGWREKAKDEARRMWRNAVSPAEYIAAVQAEIDAWMAAT